jgi:phospholipid/cholesterol/gamma-HCH transport system substrate-binding protein
MKDERKTEIKVGIISIAGIIIFLWILGWAKDFSFRSTERDLLIRFPQVSGLEIGDYVTVNGVRKGNVSDIAVKGENVLVKLELSNDVDLRKDATFAIMMLDLMGGKKIEVSPGRSEERIDFRGVQQGMFYADIPSVMSLLGSVQEDLTASIKDLRITLSSMNEYLTDKNLKQEITSSVQNLNKVLQKMNTVIDQNKNSIEELTKNTAELTHNANVFLNENNENISSSIKDLKKVLVNADSLLTSLNGLASETKDGKNNLGRILYDKELFNKLETTLNQLNELTRIMNEQLKSDGLKVDADVDIF